MIYWCKQFFFPNPFKPSFLLCFYLFSFVTIIEYTYYVYWGRHVNGNTTNMWCIRLLFMSTFNISKFTIKDKVCQTYATSCRTSVTSWRTSATRLSKLCRNMRKARKQTNNAKIGLSRCQNLWCTHLAQFVFPSLAGTNWVNPLES